MNYIDWLVLASTLIFITVYGLWRNRRSDNISEYLLANRSLPWYTVALSIIATQASAITFLSAPGQGYFDGVRFVQFYLGLPLAMFVVAKVFLPRFYGMHVITAYEMIEKKFDWRVRVLTAVLFLLQRGLAAGLVISAPSIILNEVLGWNFYLTVAGMGGIVVLYTTVGGAAAISQTQFQQMLVILFGMAAAAYIVVANLPEQVSLGQAFSFAAKAGKMNAIDFSFDWKNKYNVWSGLIGGFFLALSYFGTDQSQVERYISAKSIEESRKGLFFNAMFKLPMQFGILTIGALLFVMFQFQDTPIYFKTKTLIELSQASPENNESFNAVHANYHETQEEKMIAAQKYVAKPTEENFEIWKKWNEKSNAQRQSFIDYLHKTDKKADDKNYLFLYFVLHYLPHGLIGLLIAVIFFASMSTTASEINALASVSVVDIYQRFVNKEGTDKHYVSISRWLTVIWAIIAVTFALSIQSSQSLIETINEIGSLFYGVILGIFLLVFYSKNLSATAVLWAALLTEIGVLYLHFTGSVSFLWYNVAGCLGMIAWAYLLNGMLPKSDK